MESEIHRVEDLNQWLHDNLDDNLSMVHGNPVVLEV